MAAKKTKKIMVEIDIKALQKLIEAASALSEVAAAASMGTDDAAVKAKLGKKKR